MIDQQTRAQASLNTRALLVCLTLIGSAVPWWPWHALRVPLWMPLSCVAAFVWLAVVLAPLSWRGLVLASSAGTFGGVYLFFMIWPGDDPLGGFIVICVAAAMTLLVVAIGFLAHFAIWSRLSANTTLRRFSWVALLVGVISAAASIAFAPALMAQRILRNEQLALERLSALQDAMGRAVETYRVTPIYAARLLAPYYFGPSFTNMEWSGAVNQDGYIFIITRGSEDRTYTISARPIRAKIDGNRQFCADQSGNIECPVERTEPDNTYPPYPD